MLIVLYVVDVVRWNSAG